MIKLRKVISGGQTGVDQAALRAAFDVGLETGGWAPKDFRTEEGTNLRLRKFGLLEHPSFNYRARTEANVLAGDATLVLGNIQSPGSKLTVEIALSVERPFFYIPREDHYPLDAVAEWLDRNSVEVLNVAGNRESVNPGVGLWAQTLLTTLFNNYILL